MDYALQPHLYRNVPAYLWPCVWWQLFQIERWIKATGRMVLGGVARDGKVYILHVADDSNERKPWSPEDLRPLKCRHQDWIAAFTKLAPRVSPHGERSRTMHAPRPMVRLRSPCGQLRSLFYTAYNPTRHGDQLTLAMRLLEWPLMNTLIGCNEPLRIAPPALAQPPPIFKTPISPDLIRGLVRQVRTRGTRSRVKPGTVGAYPPTGRPHALRPLVLPKQEKA